jgi:hypothetical protein
MDDAEFTGMDAELFERIHCGSLDPIAFQLRGGRVLSGQVLAIHRHGSAGSTPGEATGEILVATESDTISLSYTQIANIL